MKQIELIEKRKPREKHFLQEDGTIIAKIYSDDIHFFDNGKLEEIDNSLIEDENFFYNNKNSYKVCFGKLKKDKLLKLENNKHYLEFDLKGKKDYNAYKNRKNSKCVKYHDIINNVDIDYEIKSNKVKESIILKDRESITTKFEFDISTNLQLTVNDDGSISSIDNGIEIFKIEAPYMIDAKNEVSKNAKYNLKRIINKYILELSVDEYWLKSADRTYPVIIDPTITNNSNSTGVQDTYICSDTLSTNYNARDYLLIGAELFDGHTTPTIYRSLIKFDLPTIPTSCEIIEANLRLIGYPHEDIYFPTEKRLIEIHKITESWNETEATWTNMNNKFDERVETCFYGGQSYYDTNNEIIWEEHYANITSLVKKWYTNEENNGILLKISDETVAENDTTFTPKFMSNANIVSGDNPQPTLIIKYRNQNGLEDYLEYFSQDFSVGKVSINSFNGNLVGIFNIASFIVGKLPIALNIVYNTNDVVREYNIGYGLGCRLNLAQTIQYNFTDDILSYVDFDGTTHYFHNSKQVYDNSGSLKTITAENVYYDEDGLELTITSYNGKYEMKDKDGIIFEFTKQESGVAILTKITDNDGDYVTISYSNGLIAKITDSQNKEITLTYSDNYLVVDFLTNQTRISYSNNRLYTINYGESDYNCSPLYFDYNDQDLISAVQYNNYKRVEYEYYNKYPYKVKKVIDSKGEYFTINYNTSSTTLIDNLGRIITLTYNDYGNVCSISNLKSQDFVKSALGRMGSFGEEYQEKNKLISAGPLIGYINNLLSNTSFETDENIFTIETGITSDIVNDYSNSGLRSLKVSCTQGNTNISKILNVTKGHSYTFSAYVKNDIISNIKLSLEYTDGSNQNISSICRIENINNDFARYDVSIDYTENATTQLILKIGAEATCNFYIDDIQLEEGNVANPYNYIDNSDFSNGTAGWNLDASQVINGESVPVAEKFEIVTLNDNSKALKIKMGPLYSTGIGRSLPISGSQGDNYTISFWYKNQGIKSNDDLHCNCCLVGFEYKYGQCAIPSINLNPNNEEWQFFTYNFIAEHDYTSINLSIFQCLDANDLYITNLSLLKNIKNTYLVYDENGNVSRVKNFNENITNYNYDENSKLIQMFEESGNNLSFEYDENLSKRIINGISEYGVSNQIKYDENNNPVVTSVSNKIVINMDDGIFKIRLNGTNKYLNYINRLLSLSEINDIQTRWNFESTIIDDVKYFKIYHPIIENAYVSNVSSIVGLDEYNISNSLFNLIKRNNGSYLIKLYNAEKYIKVDNDNIVFADFDDSIAEKYEFYFEWANNYKFIENSGSYTDDGNFIKKITNSSFNITDYEYDSNYGTLNKFTNVAGVTTHYFYNELTKNLSGIYVDEKSISYIYNDSVLSTINYIVSGNILKSYFYSYDEKNRLKTVRVGLMDLSYPLFTNLYDDNTGNLISREYANNSSITYEYDNMDRVYKIITDDDIYKHYYYKNGNLGKVLSNNNVYKYFYGDENRILKYIYDNFVVNYTYNDRSRLAGINYKLNSMDYNVNYEYGLDDMITNIFNSNGNTKYIYDELGRVSIRKFNDNLLYQNEYISNGQRDTSLIKNTIFNNHIYNYKYDKLENVKCIYHNGALEKRYIYDKFNQIIREDNYKEKVTIRYCYDQSGNISYKKEYNLNSYDLIHSYKYGYYMPYNIDVLTSFDGESISYDDCFNPVSIGSNITLSWKNRNQLSMYIDNINNLNISYSYNKDGLRTKKIINNNEVNYYWANGNLIIQKIGDNVLFFIYDVLDNLIGFEYNNTRYNYIKNSLNEIIGILDSNNNLIAKYEYDAWGKLLRIYDENNNEISQNYNHIANINPFLFKCYYYDRETGLYYLKSRYYNPEWCRFISPDETINSDIHGTNPYIYCANNPVNKEDSSGELWYPIVKFIVGAAIGVAINAATNVATGKKWNEGLVGAAIGGGIGLLIDNPILGSVISNAAQSVIDEVSSYIDDVDIKTKKNSKSPVVVEVNTKKDVNSKNVSESIKNIVVDTASGAISGAISKDLKINKLSDKIAKFNSGWFNPSTFKGLFTGKYTFRYGLSSLVSGTIDAGISEGVNLLLGPTELTDTTAYPDPPPCIFETRCQVQFPIIKQ